MRTAFYKGKLLEDGLEVLVPADADDRKTVSAWHARSPGVCVCVWVSAGLRVFSHVDRSYRTSRPARRARRTRRTRTRR